MKEEGSANRLHKKWEKICIDYLCAKHLSHTRFKQICRTIIRDFDRLPITDEKKPRVGIVGEILVKFLPAANNHLAELLEKEGAEPVVPGSDRLHVLLLLQSDFKAKYLGTKSQLPKWPMWHQSHRMAAQRRHERI